MAFFSRSDFNLSGFGAAQRIHGATVTAGMLNVLGLHPFLGRNFSLQEEHPGGAKVVLLGYDLWQRLFGGRRDALGRALKLSGESYTVIGVLPREAIFPDRTEFWTCLAVDPNSDHGWYLGGIGRLKHGVSIEQARADLSRVHTAAHLQANKITSPVVTALRNRYLGDFQVVSRVLLAAVGIVLLIACVNVSALTMVRAFARLREMAIRAAVGASPSRLIRQLLTENLVLASLGGIAGVALGYLLLRGLLALMPLSEMPSWLAFPMDARFAAFCVLVTGSAALLSGLMPALQTSRIDSSICLQENGTRSSFSRRSRRTLSSLVVCEIALALVLLVSAGLLLRAFQKVLNVDPGFRPEHVVTFSVELPETSYQKPAQRLVFFDKALARLRAIPGLEAAGAASTPPLGGHWGGLFVAEGTPPLGPREKNPVVLKIVVTPGYFDAIGMSLVAGRRFDDRDNAIRVKDDGFTAAPAAPLVAIVSESFARRYWTPRRAVGKRIRHQGDNSPWITVVGVAKDERHYGLDQEIRPSVYFPYGEAPRPGMSFVLRGISDPSMLLAPARDALRQLDPGLPIYDVHSMSERLRESMWARRAYSWLISAFAVVALALAAAGVYGVISYAVNRRTHELGIRMALGAPPAQLLRSILADGLVLVAAGVTAGLALSWAALRYLDTLLFDVSPHDPLIYSTVIVGLTAICLLANLIPARRAATIDPPHALRDD